jgi:hypothetical protein
MYYSYVKKILRCKIESFLSYEIQEQLKSNVTCVANSVFNT